MKSAIPLCFALVTVYTGVGVADNPADDPLHGLLFSPEVLLQHRDEIGLTDKQVEEFRTRAEGLAPKAEEHQRQVAQAMGRLAELLAVDEVDEEAALKQLDEVLATEKALKRLHFRLMIQLRNGLTAEQRQVAARIQRHRGKVTAGTEQRLQAKISRIQKEVQARAEAGQPPFEAVGLMQKFPELMQRGQVKEAEALLDRVMALLGLARSEEDVGEEERAAPKQEKPLSEKALRAEVDALRKKEVAWRKIAWKTCLLDGLKASREQKKPLMVWIFIDRPIDDERC